MDALTANLQTAGGLANLINAIGGTPNQTSSTSGGTTTSQTILSSADMSKILQQAMDSTQGLSSVTQGQKTAGIYNSSTNSLMVNDLLSRLTTQVALNTAPKVTTESPRTQTNSTGATATQNFMQKASLPISLLMMAGPEGRKKALKALGMEDFSLDNLMGTDVTSVQSALHSGDIDSLISSNGGFSGTEVVQPDLTPMNATDTMSSLGGAQYAAMDYGTMTDVPVQWDADYGSPEGMDYAAANINMSDVDSVLDGIEGTAAVSNSIPYLSIANSLSDGQLTNSEVGSAVGSYFGGPAGAAVGSMAGEIGGEVGQVAIDAVSDGSGEDFVKDFNLGDASVICTELHRQGKMSSTLYSAELRNAVKKVSIEALLGYHLWGKPVARNMRTSKLLTAIFTPFAMAWAEKLNGKDSILGNFLWRFGVPFCEFLGRRVLKNQLKGA